MAQNNFNSEYVFENIKHISNDIGPRMTGSENCKKTGDFIASSFQHLGLVVKEQTYDARSIELIDHSLEILDSSLGFIPCEPYLFTNDTTEQGIESEIVLVEEGEEDILGSQLQGRIVLWCPRTRGSNPRGVLKYDPLAILIISSVLGAGPRHDFLPESLLSTFNPVTTFQISWEEANRLVQQGAKRARLKLSSRRISSQGRNIIADVKGSQYPDEIITICAHYDSPPNTPSAVDNASGTAIMMELARLYSQRGSKRTLRFIAFDGEEAGYVGSRHYLKMVKEQSEAQKKQQEFRDGIQKTELEQHLFCLNLDVLGMSLGMNTCHVQGPHEVSAVMNALSKELGVPHQVVEGMYGSDNDPFAMAGIPGLTFGRMGPPFFYIHTDQDTLELIDIKQIQKIGDFVDVFISRNAANAECWPFERNVPEAQIKHLNEMMKKWMGTNFETD